MLQMWFFLIFDAKKPAEYVLRAFFRTGEVARVSFCR